MDQAGVSEIVGALMLVLVVTIAASSLAAFVQSQQKRTQQAHQLELSRTLERLEILDVVPTQTAPTDDHWQDVTFTIVNPSVDTVQLLGVRLNKAVATSANITRAGGPAAPWNMSTSFDIASGERILVKIDPTADFADPKPTLFVASPLELDLRSARANHFERDFLPPTAVALVDVKSLWNGAAYKDTVILDGTNSDHPDKAARIVKWTWTVTPAPSTAVPPGRIVRAYECDGTNVHDITLRVEDNFGLFATDTITAYVC